MISGSASNAAIIVEAGDTDKVQIILNGVSVTNTSSPAIYVKSADKVFVTTAEGTQNALTVSGAFTADGDTNTDAVTFSKDDLVLNGLGTLSINSSDNGVEPYAYLALVLTDMQYMGKPFSNETLESLMPWSNEMKQSFNSRTKPTSSSDE